jgi:hypothetical protein
MSVQTQKTLSLKGQGNQTLKLKITDKQAYHLHSTLTSLIIEMQKAERTMPNAR